MLQSGAAIPIKPPSEVHEIDESLLEPFKYLNDVPGKNVRGLLIKAFNAWLDVPEDKLKQIDEVVRNLHTASLLVDDIEDNSKLRRGVPVAHSIYGVPHTLNTANYVYVLALEECRNLGNLEALDVFFLIN